MRAWIRGRPVDRREAVTAAGRILGKARAPIIGGLAGDVEAIRAAYRLALHIGASMDAEGSGALYADLAVLASHGAMVTTWAETRARADVLLVIGARAAGAPLLKGILDHSPIRPIASTRQVVSIGSPLIVEEEHHVAVDPEHLPAALGLLRAVVAGRLPAANEPATFAKAADKIRKAKFGVAIYDPGELGELAIAMLQGLVKDLNDKARFSSLPLGVANASCAALAVGTWMTGEPPRVGFGRFYPEHDPWRFDAVRLISSGEADAALWLASLPTKSQPPDRGVPTTALLRQAGGGEAEIVFEVAVPGLDSPGVVFDQRRGTLVHLDAGRPRAAATAACVIDAIRAAIGEEGIHPC
jgi:formylmethanofuran dehydrogenase subunit B